MSNPLDAALYYISRGWAVIHLHYPISDYCSCKDGPFCGTVGKHPIPLHGSRDGTTDPEQVHRWFSQWPKANVGIVTGKISGIFAVDVDPRHNGDETLRALESEHGELPQTVEAITGSGGRHLLFRHPGKPVRNDSDGKLLGQGIDIRGEGGLIVASPSRHVCGGSYEWELSGHPSEVEIADAPEWLLSRVVKSEQPAPTQSATTGVFDPPDDSDIHQRNLIDHAKRYLAKCTPAVTGQGGDNKTFSVAGHLLAFTTSTGKHLSPDDVSMLMVNSEWNSRCSPPWTLHELSVKANSAARNGIPRVPKTIPTPHPLTPCPVDDDPLGNNSPAPVVAIQRRKLSEMKRLFPHLREELLQGMLRIAEIMNIVGASKSKKSYLAADLALSIATGTEWLGHQTIKGRVLIIDNELDPTVITQRLTRVAEVRGLAEGTYDDNLEVINLRGHLQDINTICKWLCETIKKGEYSLIILDALYRLFPKGTDENSNSDITAVYNLIDRTAQTLDSAFTIVHHTSKGNQSDKRITDVGSGASAQARCPDTHAALREHEQEDVFVLEAVTRSFAQPEAICIRWEHPVFSIAHNADPTRLKKAQPANKGKEWEGSPEDFARKVVGTMPRTKDQIEATAHDEYGMSRNTFKLAFSAGFDTKTIAFTGTGGPGKPKLYYATTPSKDAPEW